MKVGDIVMPNENGYAGIVARINGDGRVLVDFAMSGWFQGHHGDSENPEEKLPRKSGWYYSMKNLTVISDVDYKKLIIEGE